jgi:hypothetical protein
MGRGGRVNRESREIGDGLLYNPENFKEEDMRPWIKAGVAGGVLQIVFTLPILLFYFLPIGIGLIFALCVSCFFCLLYPVPGILGAYWTPVPRTTSQAAKTGALAGLLATGIDSVATLILVLITSLLGLTERYVEQFIPNATEIIQQSGSGFWFSTGGQLLQAGITLIFHVIIGVILSVLGGMIFVAIRKEKS